MSFVKIFKNMYYGIHPDIVYPDINVKHLIDLTENKLTKVPKNVTYKHFPITDRKVSKNTMEIIKYIESLKGKVYIFCKGGHGRSGYIAAILYGRKFNICGTDSLKYINNEWNAQRDQSFLSCKIRKLGSPQTKAQKKCVLEILDNISF
jgi:hypothetical protein